MHALHHMALGDSEFLTMTTKVEDSQRQVEEDRWLQEQGKISQESDKPWQSELEALPLSSAMNENQVLKVELEKALESELHSESLSVIFENSKDQLPDRKESQTPRQLVETAEILEHDDRVKVKAMDLLGSATSELEESGARLSTREEVIRLLRQMQNDLIDFLRSNSDLALENSEFSAMKMNMKVEDSQQLETAETTVEVLRSDGFNLKSMDMLSFATSELEESGAKASSLEEVVAVSKLQNDLINVTIKTHGDSQVQDDEIPQTTTESSPLLLELASLQTIMEQLISARKAAETRCQEEQTLSNLREAEHEAEIEDLKARVLDKETELQSMYAENEELKSQLSLTESSLEIIEALKDKQMMDKETEMQSIFEDNELLKAKLMDKETRLQSMFGKNKELKFQLSETKYRLEKVVEMAEGVEERLKDKAAELQSILGENELLKEELEDREMENAKVKGEVEAARDAEREAVMKLGDATAEADERSRRAAMVAKQLQEAEILVLEMKAGLELQKLVSDQWRNAAAAGVISTGENGGKKLDDDELPKKKNMLKKIGALYKKIKKDRSTMEEYFHWNS